VATPPVPAPTPAPSLPETPTPAPRKVQGGFAGGKTYFSTKFPQTVGLQGWGAPNPLAPLRTPGVTGVKSFLPPKAPILTKNLAPWRMRGGRAFAAYMLIQQLQGGFIPDDIESQKQVYKDLGYPDDVATAAAEAYNDASKAGIGASSVLDFAAQDLQAGAIGAGIGAAAGSVIPGFGTLAGAGIGWAAGTTVAGISNMLMIAESALNALAPEDAVIGMSGKWIDIPTLDDFLPGISGIVGEESYYGGAANSAGAMAADATIATKYPNRFNNTEYVYREMQRLDSNYYAMSADEDPRAGEMYDLISQGYFVKQTPNGLGIDNKAYYEYLSKTMMYRDMEDKKKFLPKGTMPFLNGATMTEDQWYSLFGNAE